MQTVEQLEEILSRPHEADVEAMRELEGDIVILGVAGKMGPSLARRAARAVTAAGVKKRIYGVARFSTPGSQEFLAECGVEPIAADLLEDGVLAGLPDAPNVIYMTGRKFGSTENAHLTWAMNTYLPGMVADRYRNARIVSFSSGNVYPLVPVVSGGATEATPVDPVGEYAQSALGRERMFEHFSARYGTPGVILRLNYAIDLRYGVLLDIGLKVFERRPVELAMGAANVIWQGDANSICLRSFPLCQAPPLVLNLTGPETASVRSIAARFGEIFGVDPEFEGQEGSAALLNNAARCFRVFGYPTVSLDQMIEWIAHWIGMGGATHNKPTHFETRDGKF
ncbi:MAG: NAD(P)-dependent oxidoreductase [Bryobacterales bacterium]|nr:NAD(P)-dependent oxidoreductase [Bryobacterales bacterium]